MLAPLDPWTSAAVGAGAGLVVGSFVATVAVRWPHGGSAMGGRSRCDSCRATLRAHELVPLLSWAVQRGRCRRCGGRIAGLHPAMEAFAALIGSAALAVVPGAGGVAGAAFGWVLLLLAVLDLRHFWLPDRLTLPLLVAGLAAAAIDPPSLAARAIGAVAGFATLEALRLIYARLRGKAGLGAGDAKLLAASGAWLGWAALPMVLLAASLAGLAFAAVLRMRGAAIDATTRLPLGALLAPAAFVGWLAMAVQHRAG